MARLAGAAPSRPSRLCGWLVLLLLLHLAAWVGWFVIAARHPVAEVPLATEGRAADVAVTAPAPPAPITAPRH